MGDEQIKRVSDLLNEKSEIAGAVVLVAAFALLFFEKLEQWPFVAMVGLALTTFLGAGYYGAKFKVGPDGMEVEQ